MKILIVLPILAGMSLDPVPANASNKVIYVPQPAPDPSSAPTTTPTNTTSTSQSSGSNTGSSTSGNINQNMGSSSSNSSGNSSGNSFGNSNNISNGSSSNSSGESQRYSSQAAVSGTDVVRPTNIPDPYLHIRDPFKQGAWAKKDLGVRSELESFPTEKFTLIGVLSGLNGTRAMLFGPNHRSYVVTENTKIGQRKGYIAKIMSTKVLVKEKVLNLLGQEEDVEVDLPLDLRTELNQPGGRKW